MSEPAANFPMFYKQPQALSVAVHGRTRIKNGDYGFAIDSPYVPLMLSEFSSAAGSYPIVFTGENAVPLILVGLQSRNLFVENGAWDEHAYLPAYVRRYPFTTLRMKDDAGFAMVVDMASDRLVEEGGEAESVPLFEGDAPSAYTKQVVTFCEIFQADALATELFGKALIEQDLLVDRRADVTLPDGVKMGVNGFRIVDPQRFAALDEKVVLNWHRNGWLGLVHFHLASLDRFHDLMKRQARITKPS